MKSVFLILFSLLLFSVHSKGEYVPLKMYYMILTADKIVYGEIVKMSEAYFYVIDSVDSNKEIKIKKYVDWTCSSRWSEYQIGQKVLLFLNQEKGYYKILSGGGEGEMPVIQDSVIVSRDCLHFTDSLYLSLYRTHEYTFKIGKKIILGHRFMIWDFINSLTLFKTNFAINKDVYPNCGAFIEKNNQLNPKNVGSPIYHLFVSEFNSEKNRNCR